MSKLVAAGLEPSVHIRTDDFLRFIVNGWIDPAAPESAHQNHVLGGSFTLAAIQFAAGGYNAVLDGHILPDGLNGMTPARRDPWHPSALRRGEARTRDLPHGTRHSETLWIRTVPPFDAELDRNPPPALLE